MTCEHFSIARSDGRFSGVLNVDNAPEFVIRIGEDLIRFEWPEMWGPSAITKGGKIRDLSHRHPFWRAVSLWNLQGRRVEDGEAVWHEPRKMIILKQIGRHIIEAIDGEEGENW